MNREKKKSRGRRTKKAASKPESAGEAKAFLARIAVMLEGRYGTHKLTRMRPDPLDTLIETILSQNTNDRNRDAAYETLRARFATWADAAGAKPGELGKAIRKAGLWRSKAASIQRALAWANERFGGYSLEGLRRMDTGEITAGLLSIKGVGAKTAHVVLAINLGRDVLPVDTHCLRLLKRFGILPPDTGLEKAHSLMEGMAGKGRALSLHLNLIRHGREVCSARSPKCASCFLAAICPSKASPPAKHRLT